MAAMVASPLQARRMLYCVSMPNRTTADVVLWRLRKDGNEAEAALRWIETVGWEVRLSFRGDLRQSRVFKADRDAAIAWADEWRADLKGRGWEPYPKQQQADPSRSRP